MTNYPSAKPNHPTNSPRSFHNALIVQLTQKCNASCRFCGTYSHPRANYQLDITLLEKVLGEAAAARPRIQYIELTGGEPFMVPQLLSAAAKYLSSVAMPYTVVTNGFWASSVEKARRHIAELPGVQRLVLSMDSYHAEFVPTGNIVNALHACRDSNVLGLVSYCLTKQEWPPNPLSVPKPIRDAVAESPLLGITITPVMDLGRAKEECLPDVVPTCVEGPCHILAHMTVTPKGEYYACCVAGSYYHDGGMQPLKLGCARESSEADMHEAALNNHLVRLLACAGPARIMRMLGQEPNPQHLSICSACHELQQIPGLDEKLRDIQG